MPFWDDPDYARSGPIRVEGGIRARSKRGDIGSTWWSRRFVNVLESLELGGRLARGRSYARAGQVVTLDVGPGAVAATVQGSRPRPYRVTVGLEVLTPRQWARIERAIAGQVIFSAKLLAGELPEDLEDVFDELGLSLFPTSAGELSMDCTCPDVSVPCKHLAATLYLLAEAFDADPFLVLTWRGRDRGSLLASLRALRGSHAEDAAEPRPSVWDDLRAVPLPPLADCADRYFSCRGKLIPIEARQAKITEIAVPDAVLRERDPLPVAAGGAPAADLLRGAYQAMGERPRG